MKSNKGCWTCKKRKIGCDKNIPSCNNCLRTNRRCLGYTFRLTWPDHPDNRRSKMDPKVHAPTGDCTEPDYGEYFLNFTFQDVILANIENLGIEGLTASTVGIDRVLSFHSPLLGQDALLLSYYENIISPMISTTQARNGFSTEILPLALSSRTASASALCQALLSISAFHHLGREAALPYKLKALRQLSHSISANRCVPSSGNVNVQLAACMMLCMHSVFDQEEGNWNVHLNGARRMLHDWHFDHPQHFPSEFLASWFLYYDVLGDFTKPTQNIHHDEKCHAMLQGWGTDISIIFGSLGCSIELFDIVSRINRLRVPSMEGKIYSAFERIQCRADLESKLRNLSQRLDPDEDKHATPARRIQVLSTAELYRQATLLYLRRVCPIDEDNFTRTSHLEEAFRALGKLKVATSPWPIFILACESQSEEQRIAILRTLDRMDSMRSIGNVFVMRNIIENIWKQYDLRLATDSNQQLNWCDLVRSDAPVPWFA